MKPFMIEHEAHTLRTEILKLAARHNADSWAFALALADVLADLAIAHDMKHGRSALSDRLDLICQRVEETYRRLSARLPAERPS